MSYIFIQGNGLVAHTADLRGVPVGTSYWIPQEGELPETREYRDAWQWNTTRPADGVA